MEKPKVGTSASSRRWSRSSGEGMEAIVGRIQEKFKQCNEQEWINYVWIWGAQILISKVVGW